MKKVLGLSLLALALTACGGGGGSDSSSGGSSNGNNNQINQQSESVQAIENKPQPIDKEISKSKVEFKLDSVETANCAAAAMKSQEVEVFSKWFDVLEQKYTLIYPDKNKDEVEAYTTERVLDKRRSLQSKGYDSKPAFNKYYQMNCVDYEPK